VGLVVAQTLIVLSTRTDPSAICISSLPGTGTFGRVLLVRLRPPYRSSSYHPIFPSLKYAPAESGEPTPEQTSYADAQLPHYAMKVLAKSEIVRLKQVEHINSERAILERVRHPFLVEL
jgi:protein kinase A